MKMIDFVEQKARTREKVETGFLDINERAICLGDYVKKNWGSAHYDGVSCGIYRIHKVVYCEKEERFLLGNPDIENASYNIWDDKKMEIVNPKYAYLAEEQIEVDSKLQKLELDDMSKRMMPRHKRIMEKYYKKLCNI